MSRYLRTYLLAVALPALLLALFGAALIARHVELLRRERAERLAQVAGWGADAVAAEVREILDSRLRGIEGNPDPLRELRRLAREDPLVRNAFLWRKDEGCVWPRRTGAAEEERKFLFRYEPLFSGAVPWTAPGGEADAARGIRPWGSGDRQDLLAWVRLPDGDVAGVELETMAWLARRRHLDPPIPPGRKTGPAFSAELLGADGGVLLPSLLADHIPIEGTATGEASLAPLFPQWRVRVRSADSDASGASAFWVDAVLFALLLLCLAGGGLALLRAARRERLDALRKTDFVDNVSHELKTPLAGIRLEAELLAEGRLPDGPRRDRAVRSILAESDRLERLVSNLLDFGRLERGRRRFDLCKVDLGELLGEMLNDECRMPNGEANIQHSAFSIQHCDHSFAALADPDAVRRILSNLFDNAAKYAPGAPPEVTVRVAENGVAVVVADRGPGVPRGLEEKVFERFFRADDALARATNGSGIGLSLARGLARGMGGDLVYRPREGGGAEFVLTLPAAR